jgi:hypothetical protein
MRRLIWQLGSGQQMKFRCQQFRIVAGYAKDDERAGVPEHRGADRWMYLLEVLVRETKCVANLRASDNSEANASVLKLWNSSTWAKNGARVSGAWSLRAMATSWRL